MKESSEMMAGFDGTMLYYHSEIPENARAVVVIVHGLAEHQGRYDYVAGKMHDSGIGTVRFDHRGHGRSEGERTHLNDYNELLDDTNVMVDRAIAENPGLPVFLLGHSMGGFTVSLYGAKYPDKAGLKGIITSGAACHGTLQRKDVSVTEPDPSLDLHSRIPNTLGPGVCSVKEIVDAYAADPLNEKSYSIGLQVEMAKGMKWFDEAVKDFTYPVLMMHGEKDALVDVEDTYWFFRNVPSTDKQMKIYGGLFHEIFNEYCRDEVIDDTIRWIGHRI